jgi:hypothetical protein
MRKNMFAGTPSRQTERNQAQSIPVTHRQNHLPYKSRLCHRVINDGCIISRPAGGQVNLPLLKTWVLILALSIAPAFALSAPQKPTEEYSPPNPDEAFILMYTMKDGRLLGSKSLQMTVQATNPKAYVAVYRNFDLLGVLDHPIPPTVRRVHYIINEHGATWEQHGFVVKDSTHLYRGNEIGEKLSKIYKGRDITVDVTFDACQTGGVDDSLFPGDVIGTSPVDREVPVNGLLNFLNYLCPGVNLPIRPMRPLRDESGTPPRPTIPFPKTNEEFYHAFVAWRMTYNQSGIGANLREGVAWYSRLNPDGTRTIIGRKKVGESLDDYYDHYLSTVATHPFFEKWSQQIPAGCTSILQRIRSKLQEVPH